MTCNYQQLFETTSNYQELPPIATNYQQLAASTSNYLQLTTTSNYQQLPATTSNYERLLATTSRGPHWSMSQTLNKGPRCFSTYKGSGPELVHKIAKGFRSCLSVAGPEAPPFLPACVLEKMMPKPIQPWHVDQ